MTEEPTLEISKTPIKDALLLDLVTHRDTRGTFTELMRPLQGLVTDFGDVAMVNMAMSEEEGTIRGLHWQTNPSPQAKIIYAIRGGVFDAIVDVRPESPTFGKAFWAELFPGKNALYAPAGVAHGWQALSSFATLLYLVDASYAPSFERGLRYDDPDAAIPWPMPARRVSERDLKWPFLNQLKV